jgi:hypothetical protein
VISRLGGTESTVRCPWCEGTGEWRPGIDAQAHWRAEGGTPSGATAGTPADPDPATPADPDPVPDADSDMAAPDADSDPARA